MNKVLSLSRFLGRGIDKISNSAAIIAGTMMAICSLLLTYEIVMRYILQNPTKWTQEACVYLTVWFAFLAVGFGLKEGGHVSVDVLVRRLPGNIRAATDVWGQIVVLAYSIVFTRYAWKMVMVAFSAGQTSDFLGVPTWPIKLALVVGLGITALQAIKLLISKFHELYREKYLKQTRPILSLVIIIAVTAGCMAFTTINPIIGLFALLIFALAIGVPISFSLGFVSAVGFFFLFGGWGAVESVPLFAYGIWQEFTIMALPLFIYVGYIMFRTGMSDDLFAFASSWFGHLPGGLAVATLASTAIFAAITGSSVVCAITIGLVAIPALAKRKYNNGMAAGVVASGGTLGILIPPSAAFITYGIMAEVSIGRLFIAGMIPGILLFVLLSITAVILCKISGEYEPMPKSSWKGRLITTKNSLYTLMMPVIVLGCIYTGVCTVTEAAGLAVVYSLAVIIIKQGFKLKQMVEIIRESTRTVAMVCILLAGAVTLSKVVTMLQIPQQLIRAVGDAGMGSTAVILSLMGILLIMGMFLEGLSITLIITPIVAPMLLTLGVDLIWFGVLFVINMEIAMLTPPVGLNLYVIQQISGIRLETVIKGSLPFILALLVGLAIIMLVPPIATWLPSTMG
jgi:tripartite ATP-independent transporter DctM subunit